MKMIVIEIQEILEELLKSLELEKHQEAVHLKHKKELEEQEVLRELDSSLNHQNSNKVKMFKNSNKVKIQ